MNTYGYFKYETSYIVNFYSCIVIISGKVTLHFCKVMNACSKLYFSKNIKVRFFLVSDLYEN